MVQGNKISFSVLTIECIACMPVFKRELAKLPGIKTVKPLVMMNVINVEIDPNKTTRETVKAKILEIATRAGFGGKVVFS